MITQPPVSWAVGKYLGLPGSLTRYFWVQVVYPSGRSVVSSLIEIDNSSSITRQNQINLQWAVAPGAIGYDVVETSTSAAPTLNATATIAVVQGLTDTNYTLSAEPTLQSWTYSAGNGSSGGTVTGVGAGAGIAVDSTNPAVPIVSVTNIIAPVLVAALPTPAAGLKGARSTVSDANTTLLLGIGTTVVGGASGIVPVFCDGTNWLIG